MSRRLIIVVAALVLITSGVGAAVYVYAPHIFASVSVGADPGKTQSDNPETVIRARDSGIKKMLGQLAEVQDRAAFGARDAIPAQRRLLSEIAVGFRGFGDHQWSEYFNFRMALVYVLSGGEPEILTKALANASLGDADKNLGQGVMKFALGQMKAARTAWKDIDPMSLDVALMGPFALARASLYIEKEPLEAIALLDDARLVSPHTAIEEAAARREVPLLIAAGEGTRAKLLVADYIRRFGKSLYAPRLFREFAEAIAKSNTFDDTSLVAELAASIHTSDPAVAGPFFIELANAALVAGQLKLAKAAASEVLKPGGGSAEDVARAELYIAAADAPSDQAARSLATLGKLAGKSLSDEDSGLKEVAGFIARVVTGAELSREEKQLESRAGQSVPNKPPSLPQVTAALENADQTIQKAKILISEKDE